MARNQVRLDIERREPFAGGGSFGHTGPYERLFGKVHFAIDPDEEGLPSIVDLDLAPRNAQGLVEFSATLDIMKPVEPGRGNRRIFYAFSNRGNRGLMSFNYGRGADMSRPEYAGDGFLMRQGYTLMWSGWQGDLIDRGDNVVAYLPFAEKEGKPLRGRVRQEFNPMAEGILSMGVSAGAERGQDVQPYPVLDRSTATLTMRQYESDPRVPVPHSEWELAKAEVKEGEVVLTPSNIDLYIKGGFKPGWIYECIYETEGSRVMNLGFLGIRDLLSLLRYESHDAAGNPNLLAGHVEKVYGTGASLSGRVIREYVYEGWNVDAAGRRVFDAVHTHTGSGRLFQNQGFAQVGRYPRQHEEHQWPAEYYPFTFVAVPDPFTGRNEGLWQRPETDPDGNTIAGLRYPDIAVPLGTYNGWSLRKAGFAEGEQWWNTGSFVPFARTKAEREAHGDPRPSIEERYPSHAAYIAAVTRVCEERVREGLMLLEDADRFIAAARQKNPLDASVRLGPLIQAGAYTGR